ncbi:MAG: hypothetical protein JWM10_3730 [Myxococcaceae bacterium]|nr:hypothetical protein [Myxococcaceae bacterium]
MADPVDSVEGGPKRRAARPFGAVVALLFVAAAVPLLLYAARNGPDHDDRPHDPLELSDESEVRAAVLAVSGIIRAAPAADGGVDEEDRAIRALEALHPRSPGASDLRESCVTTYRGTHDAQRLQGEMHALVPRDGGTMTDEQRRRLGTMLDRSTQLVGEVRDAHLRCVGLYEQACGRLHITPAQRP